MQSDILLLFSSPLGMEHLRQIETVLMNVGRSVLVHQKEGQDRLVLVKFDPQDVKPAQLLDAVRQAGFEATMAGG